MESQRQCNDVSAINRAEIYDSIDCYITELYDQKKEANL